MGDYIACIDFGTAFSKVAIVEAAARDELEISDIFPLEIGHASANPLVVRSQFLLPSMVYVAPDKILFGSKAEKAALASERKGYFPFTSPKQYLSTHGQDDLETLLDPNVDQTLSYTAADLIIVFLAYLLKCSEVAAKKHGLPWPLKFRLARPAWDAERAAWGEQTLRSLVRHALVLTDQFDANFAKDEEVSHALLKDCLSAIPEIDGARDDEIFALSAQGTATIPEATAVGAASISGLDRSKRIIVVADIGGGTCDFAAFMTGLPNRNVVAEIEGSARVFRHAGDDLDMHLRRQLIMKSGLLPDDPVAKGPSGILRSRQRFIKEILFREGHLVEEIGDYFVEISLEEFLGDEHVLNFSKQMSLVFYETLKVATDCAKSISSGLVQAPVEIIATGGGGGLPMVQDMIKFHHFDWPISKARPNYFGSNDPNFIREYPQLAVSIGGALRDLPKQTARVRG